MTRYYEAHDVKAAIILPFERPKLPAKRGRPKTKLFPENSDTGTPELVMKKLLGQTSETLDLLLERRLISKQQHWCGIHLRWLYTLRFGAPSVRTIDLTHCGGKEITLDDPHWRANREAEYNEAIKSLGNSRHTKILLNICIHNERPLFLRDQPGKKHYTHAARDIIIELRTGLDILHTLWNKKQ